MEEELFELLQTLGLSKNESIIYVDIVKNPESPVTQIAKRTRLHRPNVYDALTRLIEKGFLSEIKKEDIRLFRALPIEKLPEYFKQKHFEAERIIRRLRLAPMTGPIKNPTAFLSKNVLSIRIVMNEIVKHKDTVNVLGPAIDPTKVMSAEAIRQLQNDSLENKTPIRYLFFKNNPSIERLNELPFTQARHLGTEKESPITTAMVGDKVYFIRTEIPFSVIEVLSKDISDVYKTYFNILWESGKTNNGLRI